MFFTQQTFTQHEVCMWEICQSFQQNLTRDIAIVSKRIKLIQFQYCKISFKIVRIFPGLILDIALESLQVFWIISEKKKSY